MASSPPPSVSDPILGDPILNHELPKTMMQMGEFMLATSKLVHDELVDKRISIDDIDQRLAPIQFTARVLTQMFSTEIAGKVLKRASRVEEQERELQQREEAFRETSRIDSAKLAKRLDDAFHFRKLLIEREKNLREDQMRFDKHSNDKKREWIGMDEQKNKALADAEAILKQTRDAGANVIASHKELLASAARTDADAKLRTEAVAKKEQEASERLAAISRAEAAIKERENVVAGLLAQAAKDAKVETDAAARTVDEAAKKNADADQRLADVVRREDALAADERNLADKHKRVDEVIDSFTKAAADVRTQGSGRDAGDGPHHKIRGNSDEQMPKPAAGSRGG